MKKYWPNTAAERTIELEAKKTEFTYLPKGTCSRKIDLIIEDGVIKKVRFTGGCNGNAQGVEKLVTGQKASEIIEKLKGINCNGKGTSCPDQLAKALESAIKKE